MEAPGILIIWGGADIHPSFYNRPNLGSYVGNSASQRDETEARLFAEAVAKNIPIFGVCRGAQLGCALSGGILIQHIGGHGHSHRMTTVTDDVYITSSIHHQMMYPWAIPHELIAWSTIPHSGEYIGLSEAELAALPTRKYPEYDTPQPIEPEIVWFPETKCLGVQGHPEYMEETHPFNVYMKELVNAYMLS